jgi:tRNA-2-methylthio-N6-dimethylallyladenosine synthase
MEGAVEAQVMDERLQRLQRRLAEHSLAFNHATVGENLTILIDRKGRLPGQMIGKSPWLQSVFVDTDATIGDMVDVTITHALPNSLGGVLRTPPSSLTAAQVAA